MALNYLALTLPAVFDHCHHHQSSSSLTRGQKTLKQTCTHKTLKLIVAFSYQCVSLYKSRAVNAALVDLRSDIPELS